MDLDIGRGPFLTMSDVEDRQDSTAEFVKQSALEVDDGRNEEIMRKNVWICISKGIFLHTYLCTQP